LSETWESRAKPVRFRNWPVLTRPREGDVGYGGVAIVYKPTDAILVKRRADLERTGVEVVCAEVSTQDGLSFMLLSVYIPPEKHIDQLTSLIEIISNIAHNNIIIAGDINAKSQEWGNEYYNAYGKHLEEFMNQKGLICVNDGRPTKRNDKSVIDLFVVKPTLIPHISFCGVLAHELIRSDHIGVLLEVGTANQSGCSQSPRVKYMLGKADWEAWEKTTSKRFDAWIKETKERPGLTVEELYDSFNAAFISCRDECVPTRQVSGNRRRMTPPWLTDKAKEARHHLNKAKKGYKRRSTEQNFNRLCSAKRECEEAEAEAKEQWVEEVCNKLNTTKNPRELWDNFRHLTSYQERDGCDVLPLIDSQGSPVFDKHEKCVLLQEAFFSGRHLESCEFDEDFKKEVEKEVEERHRNPELDDPRLNISFLENPISLDETVASLSHLTKGKAAGPDKVFTDLLLGASKNLVTAIHILFNESYETGVVPADWKKAEIKFIRKSGKSSYHQAGSYRPISLTSCLGKCLERILTTRLYAFVEHNNIIDQDQEGFRMFHSTTQALLRLTQNVVDGFNDGSRTLAAFIDMEKAYDSVWRDGLLAKLAKQGIQGKIWHWIDDFLQDRSASPTLDGWEGDPFKSTVGLPQGSVISPLLFNLYIQDIFAKVTSEKVKFADDGSLWHTGKDVTTLTMALERDLSAVQDWARLWRMKINPEKTEVCLFQKRAPAEQDRPVVRMGLAALRYNPTPRLLGVFLDEELNFNHHIDKTEAKANKALNLLRTVKSTEKINTKRLLQIYQAVVVPHLEYAAPVWQTAKGCSRLESIQRKGMVICADGMSTGSREALEVELGVLPLALRREELSVREVGKILAKEPSEPLRRTWTRWQGVDHREKTISPFGLAQMQIEDMTTETATTLHCVEPSFSFVSSLQPSRSPPDYWTTLGSSKSRSSQQEEKARTLIRDIVEGCPPDTVIAFTDGSCQPNPGPCGAGSCIILPGSDNPIELRRPVSNHGSILLGELVGILMTLEYVFSEVDLDRVENIQILSDSQSAIGLLTLGWKEKQLHSTLATTKNLMRQLESKGVTVNIDWTPGHAEIAGNEMADKLAKMASEEAKEMDKADSLVTQGILKSAARDSVMAKWQRQWDVADTGRRLHGFKPSVTCHTHIDQPNRWIFSRIARLRSGYIGLKKYHHQIGVSESPLCDRCGVEETATHYLLECVKFEDERARLQCNIFRECGVGTLTEELLLCVDTDDSLKEHRLEIIRLLGKFITNTAHI
jgi:ribonuclease HI